MTDHIHIRGLRVDCIVGIFDREREERQPLEVDIRLDVDLSVAGRSGRIGDTCDYAQIAAEVTALLQFREYKLLEMAAEELSAMILGVHSNVERVGLRIDKPQALDAVGATASVEIERRQGDAARQQEVKAWGSVDVLLETREAGLYLLHVGPGKGIPEHQHQRMRELEWLVDGTLHQFGEPLRLATPRAWQRGEVHGYTNPADTRATLFCCDTPPFIPEDEIVVGTP